MSKEHSQPEEHTHQVNAYSKPTNSVSIEDLLWSNPELAERIEQEDEEAFVDYVADKVGDALQEMYWDAMRIVLEDYFQVSPSSKTIEISNMGN